MKSRTERLRQSVGPEPYVDLDKSLGFLIYRVHQRAMAEFRRTLEPAGLTPQQFGLLALLHERDGQRQAELCARGAIDPNTMVGLIDRLVALGMVERRRDPRDRRAQQIRLTPAGRRRFRQLWPMQRRTARRLWSALTEPEQALLRELLLRVLTTGQDAGRGKGGVHD